MKNKNIKLILFIVICSGVWDIGYKLIQMLPEFWHPGLHPFLGFASCIVYYKLFDLKK